MRTDVIGHQIAVALEVDPAVGVVLAVRPAPSRVLPEMTPADVPLLDVDVLGGHLVDPVAHHDVAVRAVRTATVSVPAPVGRGAADVHALAEGRLEEPVSCTADASSRLSLEDVRNERPPCRCADVETGQDDVVGITEDDPLLPAADRDALDADVVGAVEVEGVSRADRAAVQHGSGAAPQDDRRTLPARPVDDEPALIHRVRQLEHLAGCGVGEGRPHAAELSTRRGSRARPRRHGGRAPPEARSTRSAWRPSVRSRSGKADGAGRGGAWAWSVPPPNSAGWCRRSVRLGRRQAGCYRQGHAPRRSSANPTWSHCAP